jgi:hypothetical protein
MHIAYRELPGSDLMTKTEECARTLLGLQSEQEWTDYLCANSGLPGPRANLELLAAYIRTASTKLVIRFASLPAGESPPNTPQEFLLVCGTAALGRLMLEQPDSCGGRLLAQLRTNANDPRWRVREAVAIALQTLGRGDYRRLMAVANDWMDGTHLDRRAVAAAVAEPDLLRRDHQVCYALGALDRITAALSITPRQMRRGDDSFRVLRQALAYCWSVIIAANPQKGSACFERWVVSGDPDVRWLVAGNLRKARLRRAAPHWVAEASDRLAARGSSPRLAKEDLDER